MKFFWLVVESVVFWAVGSALIGCSSQTPVSTPANESAPPSTAASAPSASLSASPVASGVPARADKMCGGIAGFRCDAGQYCAFPLSAHCGAGDMAGVCKPLSDMCTMEFAPVCGCDGKTYATACVAGRTGMSVASNGACAGDGGSALADGALCGTRGVHGECEPGSYCAYKSQCGSTDSGGVCTKRPEICNDSFVAVCGCDGKTYPNACHAQRQGVSVAAPGACQAN